MYKRPPTIGALITSYKKLLFSDRVNDISPDDASSPCGHCAQTNFGLVLQVLQTNFGNFNLRQNLTCSNYGIYVATCQLCNNQYVGQTKNKFSTRWNSHRKNWKNFDFSLKSDKAALLKHFYEQHRSFLVNKPDIAECFFVEQPPVMNLDVCEDKWVSLIRANLNIKKIICPRVM